MAEGVLLAAGRGRRMGGTKQLLPWPPAEPTTTLIEAAYDALAPHCARMIVVLGHEADRVAQQLAPRAFTRVVTDPDAPMSESIKSGLRKAAGDVLLHPADHPEVPELSELFEKYDARRAVIPEYEGKGGHPILIGTALVREIAELELPDGLGVWFREHPERAERVVVVDRRFVRDVDTPGNL